MDNKEERVKKEQTIRYLLVVTIWGEKIVRIYKVLLFSAMYESCSEDDDDPQRNDV